MSRAPLLVLSDLHLAPGPRSLAVGVDAARLLRSHPQHEVVFNGDIFNLSVDPVQVDPADSVAGLLRAHFPLVSAIRERLEGGHPVTFIAGNHDAPVMNPRVADALRSVIQVPEAAPLSARPWFLRRHDVHVEHGHLYDPDNAPAHPLAEWSPATEPLGLSLTRRFLAPQGALAFHHAHDMTPLAALLRALRLFGPRTPLLVARYLFTTAELCLEAGRQPGLRRERLEGRAAEAAFATLAGVERATLRRLLALGPSPTHHDPRAVFMRLYFDRILAGIGGLGGGAIGAALRLRIAMLGATAAIAYLVISSRSGSRFAGLPQKQLRRAAAEVAAITGASTVIFGHTHERESSRVRSRHGVNAEYRNCGSFAYARGTRPYVCVDANGRAHLRGLASDSP